MSAKHYFPSTAANTLVPRYLRSLVAANSHLVLDEAERIVADSQNDPHTVTIIGGGGSGHEPAWSGFVGQGLLGAAACGDIFASPSTKQVLAAMRAAPSNEGVILFITNYTGDRLHFGLAAERAKAEGLAEKVVVLPATDDTSLGRTRSAALGRRGLPGHVITMKILCGAAANKHSFEKCLEIGRAVNSQVVSIGSSLDHCHVPGREGHKPIDNDVCVIGAGIHNEPGAQQLSPFPPVEEVIHKCLEQLCRQDDPERGFVKFNGEEDAIVLLINNYGGLSNLELGALADEVQMQLASTWGIRAIRTLFGAFETSLNAPGFSISLCNISAAAKESNTTPTELLALFDGPTTAVSWPNTHQLPAAQNGFASKKTNGVTESYRAEAQKEAGRPDIKVDGALLDRAIRSGCNAAIASEPRLTQWDLIMGDGDCGEAVKGVSEAILQILDAGEAKDGSILAFLASTTDAVDNMGGTLGAIFGILLSAFASALRSSCTSDHTPPTAALIAQSLATAVSALKSHTSAREGDRTVMDVLLPFADAFAATCDFGAAVRVAGEKAEATKRLRAKFGRATYVTEAEGQDVPDPGAWALYEMLAGMAGGLGIQV